MERKERKEGWGEGRDILRRMKSSRVWVTVVFPTISPREAAH
jgi:hypothetical protein